MTEDLFKPPNSEIKTTQEREYAGFWRRTAASIIDSILVLMVMLPLLFMLFGFSYFDTDSMGFAAGQPHQTRIDLSNTAKY